MRVRCITITFHLTEDDFKDNALVVKQKISESKRKLDIFSKALTDENYTVQTLRISLNCVEEWNPSCSVDVIGVLDTILEENDIQFCALGGVFTRVESIAAIPYLLQRSNRISCSVHMRSPQSIPSSSTLPQCAPDLLTCTAAAEACLKLADLKGDLGNFSYCVAFNCGVGIPFFPAALNTGVDSSVAIGLENADLIFMSYFGASSLDLGRENFITTLKQALLPIQRLIQPLATSLGVLYSGIDASLNPGLGPIDSVGAGIEHILEQQLTTDSSDDPFLSSSDNNKITGTTSTSATISVSNKRVKTEKRVFGSMGTLAAVSSLTQALKSLHTQSTDYYAPSGTGTGTVKAHEEKEVLKLCGYSGLMLPVMEDTVLAERASQVQTIT